MLWWAAELIPIGVSTQPAEITHTHDRAVETNQIVANGECYKLQYALPTE